MTADDIIQDKLSEHDRRFDKVDERLVEHDRRFDKVDERLVEHDLRFDKVDERLDNLTAIVVEHGERLEQTVTKAEFEEFRKEQSNANDQMISILKRLDEERFATIEWLRRVEREVEDQKKKTHEHELLLQKIKQELKIAN